MVKLIEKLHEFYMKSSRVWTVMRKPTKEEFKIIAQASGLGLLLMGFLGFAIFVIMKLTPINNLF